MPSAAATTDPRASLYRGLMRRNRMVAALRWAVPAVGALVLLVVIGGIVIAGLSQRFGLSSIRIDRNNLVVETPELTSTTEDGTVFALSALSARVSLVQNDIVDLVEAAFTATSPTGTTTTAVAAAAQLQTTEQLLDVAGTTTIDSNNGLKGTLDEVFLDMMKWTMVAGGKVDMTLPDGTTILADSMTYDRDRQFYSFKRVTLTLPSTPGDPTP